jgi:hypothetical protein
VKDDKNLTHDFQYFDFLIIIIICSEVLMKGVAIKVGRKIVCNRFVTRPCHFCLTSDLFHAIQKHFG